MYKRVIFAVLIVSMIGCTALKEKYGTGEETPELRVARAECHSKADKETIAKYQYTGTQINQARIVFDACMKAKGYNKVGQKIR